MTTLYLTEQHAYVSKRGATLEVRVEGKNRVVIPLQQVTDVVCCGDVSWSGGALRELAEMSISIAYLDGIGRWVARWEPRESKAVLLRREQFRAADDPEKRRAIARAIITGKIRNCRALLQRSTRDGMVDAREEVAHLQYLLHRAQTASDLEAIRGIEGEAAACYFRGYGRLVSTCGFMFVQRNRRPPLDPINTMLSFGYALATRGAATAARVVGFDAHVGFLHYDRYGRESLALDLVEEFRPIVVDALVAALVHRRVLTPSDFTQTLTECRLKDHARKRFIDQFERKLASEVRHPILNQRVTHRRAMELQARILAKYLIGEVPAYVSFSKR